MTSVITADQRELDARLAGTVFTPADTDWDAARTAWNVAVEQRPAIVASARTLTDALEPWSTGSHYLNFSETLTDTRTAYEVGSYARLQTVRAQVDPHRLMHANHELA
jgi:hypothetical protein